MRKILVPAKKVTYLFILLSFIVGFIFFIRQNKDVESNPSENRSYQIEPERKNENKKVDLGFSHAPIPERYRYPSKNYLLNDKQQIPEAESGSDKEDWHVCNDKWDFIISTSLDELAAAIRQNEFESSTDACNDWERENKFKELFDDQCSPFPNEKHERYAKCVRNLEIYRAKIIDKIYTYDKREKNIPYDIAINKLMVVPYQLEGNKNDATKFDKALHMLESLIEDAPAVKEYYELKLKNLGLLTFWNKGGADEGRWEEAIEQYKRVYGKTDLSLSAEVYSLSLQGKDGGSEQADVIREYINRNPDNWLAYYYDARLLWVNGDYSEARDRVEALQKKFPANKKIEATLKMVKTEETDFNPFSFPNANGQDIFYEPID